MDKLLQINPNIWLACRKSKEDPITSDPLVSSANFSFNPFQRSKLPLVDQRKCIFSFLISIFLDLEFKYMKLLE